MEGYNIVAGTYIGKYLCVPIDEENLRFQFYADFINDYYSKGWHFEMIYLM